MSKDIPRFSWHVDFLPLLVLLVPRISDADWNLYHRLSGSRPFRLQHCPGSPACRRKYGNTWKRPSVVLNNFKLGKSPREQEPANPGSRRQQLCPFLREHVDMWLNGYSPRPLHSQYMFQGARISLAQCGSGQYTELTNHG